MFAPTLAHVFCRFSAELTRAARQKQMQKCARSAGKHAISAKKIARSCSACAASSPAMMQNVSAETRACLLQILCRTRAHLAQNKCKNARVRLACTTKSMRSRRGSCARLRHVCSAVAKTEAQCLRRHSHMFSADFPLNAHAPRGGARKNKCKNARVRPESMQSRQRK